MEWPLALHRRYLDSAKSGWSFFLFVRSDPDAAYALLGPVGLESFAGDRPFEAARGALGERHGQPHLGCSLPHLLTMPL